MWGGENKLSFLFFFPRNSQQTSPYITGQNWGHKRGWECKHLVFSASAVGDIPASQEDKGEEVDLGKAANSVCPGAL